jgi:hypothetical protein
MVLIGLIQCSHTSYYPNGVKISPLEIAREFYIRREFLFEQPFVMCTGDSLVCFVASRDAGAPRS